MAKKYSKNLKLIAFLHPIVKIAKDKKLPVILCIVAAVNNIYSILSYEYKFKLLYDILHLELII